MWPGGTAQQACSSIQPNKHAPPSPAHSETGSRDTVDVGAALQTAHAARQETSHLLQQLLDPAQVRTDITQRITIAALEELIAMKDCIIADLTEVNYRQQQLLAIMSDSFWRHQHQHVEQREPDLHGLQRTPAKQPANIGTTCSWLS